MIETRISREATKVGGSIRGSLKIMENGARPNDVLLGRRNNTCDYRIVQGIDNTKEKSSVTKFMRDEGARRLPSADLVTCLDKREFAEVKNKTDPAPSGASTLRDKIEDLVAAAAAKQLTKGLSDLSESLCPIDTAEPLRQFGKAIESAADGLVEAGSHGTGELLNSALCFPPGTAQLLARMFGFCAEKKVMGYAERIERRLWQVDAMASGSLEDLLQSAGFRELLNRTTQDVLKESIKTSLRPAADLVRSKLTARSDVQQVTRDPLVEPSLVSELCPDSTKEYRPLFEDGNDWEPTGSNLGLVMTSGAPAAVEEPKFHRPVAMLFGQGTTEKSSGEFRDESQSKPSGALLGMGKIGVNFTGSASPTAPGPTSSNDDPALTNANFERFYSSLTNRSEKS